jgi:Ser/Thr protein kinase RdoA (MazF antagonist)
VVVKRQKSHAGGPALDRWSRECEILERLHLRMGDGASTVPRIVLRDEATTLVVMERARGLSLDVIFASTGRDDLHRLRGAIRGAGAWLAAMQRASEQDGDGRELLRDIAATATSDLKRLAASDRFLSRRRDSILHYLGSAETLAGAGELRVTGHHDDYWPGNIFFDGERVTVIDFESFRAGLPMEDAAFFLLRCEMLRRRFRLRYPQLAADFFEGYGRMPDAAALRFFSVTTALRMLARSSTEGVPLTQRLMTRLAVRDVIRRAVR